MRETDLYAPIRDYLVAQGYAVQAEVKGCDVVAQKDGDLIVIEIKRQFGTRLLLQAIDRQRITDSVYVALPGPYEGGRKSRWNGVKRLLRRLEVGLIVVTLSEGPPRVEIVFHPLPYQHQKVRRRKRAVLREIDSRSGEYNEGGSTRRKVVTAYREKAIFVACCLDRLGPLSAQQLRDLGTDPRTGSILSSNFYRWFRRVARGIYELTPKGRTELATHPELVAYFHDKLDAQLGETGQREGRET
jgi:hypothetical protein